MRKLILVDGIFTSMTVYGQSRFDSSVVLDVETMAYRSVPSGMRSDIDYAFQPLFVGNSNNFAVNVDFLVVQCIYATRRQWVSNRLAGCRRGASTRRENHTDQSQQSLLAPALYR